MSVFFLVEKGGKSGHISVVVNFHVWCGHFSLRKSTNFLIVIYFGGGRGGVGSDFFFFFLSKRKSPRNWFFRGRTQMWPEVEINDA